MITLERADLTIPDPAVTIRQLLADSQGRQQLEQISGTLPSAGLAPHLRGEGVESMKELRPSTDMADTPSTAPVPNGAPLGPEPIDPPPVFNVFDLPDARPLGRGSLFG
jgi:hypothetical protein